MPLQDFQKKWALEQSGYDPAKYDIDDGGNIIPLGSGSQPTNGSAPTNLSNVLAKPPTASGGESFARLALDKAPVAAAGGVGFAGGAAFGAEVGALGGPVGSGLGALVGGLGGALLSAYGTKKALATVEPKAYREKISAIEQEHPRLNVGAELATLPLGGFNPSPKNLLRAGKTAGELLTTGKVIPLAKAANMEVNPAMVASDIQNLFNVGGGAAINTAIGATQRGVAAPEGEGLSAALSPKDLLTDAATGALFNKPNRLGVRMGFHPAGEAPQMMPSRADTYTQAEVMKLVEEAAKAQQKATATEVLAMGGRPSPVVPDSKMTIKAIENAQAKTDAMSKYKVNLEQGNIEGMVNEGGGVYKEPRIKVELPKTKPSKSYTADEAATLADQIEAAQAKPKESTDTPLTTPANQTPFVKRSGEQMGMQDVEGMISPEWFAKMQNFGLLRGVKMEADGGLTGKSGKPIAGKALIQEGAQELANRVAKINPTKGGIDTQAHEALHFFLEDLKNSTSKTDQVLHQRLRQSIETSPEYADIIKALKEQGVQDPVDEILANEGGVNVVNRLTNVEGKTPLKQWWQDFKTHVKYRFQEGNMTPSEMRNMLTFKWMADKPFVDKSGEFKSGEFKSGEFKSGAKQTKEEDTYPKDSPEYDSIKYNELVRMLKTADTTVKPLLWQQIEELKNKYGGVIPKVPTKESQNTPFRPKQTEEGRTPYPFTMKELTKGEKAIDSLEIDEVDLVNRDAERGQHAVSSDTKKVINQLNDIEDIHHPENNYKNQDQSSLVDPSHPSILEAVNTIHAGLKAEELSKEAASEIKQTMLQQINFSKNPDLREALEQVNPESPTQWTIFKGKLAKAIRGMKIDNTPPKEEVEVTTEPTVPAPKTEPKPIAAPVKEVIAKPQPKPPETVKQEEPETGLTWINKREEELNKQRLEAVVRNDNKGKNKQLIDDIDLRLSNLQSLREFEVINSEISDTLKKLSGKQFTTENAKEINELNNKLDTLKGRRDGIESKINLKMQIGEGKFSEDSPLGIYGTKIGSVLAKRLAGETDAIRVEHGDKGKVVADSFENYRRLNDRNRGELEQDLIRKLRPYMNMLEPQQLWTQDNEDFQKVVRYLDMKQDGLEPAMKLTEKQKEIEAIVRENLKKSLEMREQRPELMHETAANPNYLPHTLSREAAKEISDNPTSAKSEQYYKDFLKYQQTKDGVSKEEAETRWKIFRAAFTKRAPNLAEQFGPVDKSAGIGLPRSMREENLLDRMSRFNRRYAKRIAYHDAIEQNKEASDILFNEKSGLQTSSQVKSILENIYGTRENEEAARYAVLRVVKAGMLGPISGLRDLLTTPTLGMQHQDLSQVLPSLVYAWTNAGKHANEAFTKGVARYNISGLEMGEGGITSAINVLQRLADVVTTVQGRQHLETAARITAYGQGKYLAADALNTFAKDKSLSSQQNKFLNDFVPDHEKYKGADSVPEEVLQEAAARYVESVQGTYSFEGLPSFTQKGSLAPVFALARWSVEKMNNFNKHVVDPAMKGNYKPLLMATIGMVIGGAATTKLMEEAYGRKEKTPTAPEITEALENKPAEGVKMLGYKMASLASLAGYAGMMGDLTKAFADVQYKNKPQTLNNPLLEGVENVAVNAQDMIEAMGKGRATDPTLLVDVINQFLQDSLQVYRIGVAQFSEEHKQQAAKSDKYRDLKMFKQSRGEDVPSLSGARPNPFLDKTLKKFKRTGNLQEAATLLPELLQNAVKEADGDPYKLKKELTKIKLNSYQTIPDPENMPLSFANYLTWLNVTQGPEAAKDRLLDWVKQNQTNKAKSALVP